MGGGYLFRPGSDRCFQVATDMPEVSELLEEGRRYEGRGVLDRALESYLCAAAASADPALVSEALTHQSRIFRCRSEWQAALLAARRAQELAAAAGLERLVAEGVIAEANVLMCRGAYDEAHALFERVLATSDDSRIRGVALQNIGSILAQQGRLGAAERAFA